jgi:hypothetical protein
VNHKWSSITTFRHRDEAITHIRECHGDSNQYTHCKGKLDHTTCARSLGHYVRLPFAKSLRDQNRSSTLGMKSWFHSVRSARPSSRATSFSLQQPPQSSGYGSTKQLQKLLGLLDPINLARISIVQYFLIEAQHDAVLNWHRWGLPPRSPKYLLILYPTFASGDTPLVVP